MVGAALEAAREQGAQTSILHIPVGFAVAMGGGDPTPVFDLLFNLALSLKMKPLTLNASPYLGVFAVGGIEPREGYDPVEKARELGKLLVELARKA